MVKTNRPDSGVTITLVTVLIVFSLCQTPALFSQIFWTILSDSHRECGGFQFYWSPVANSLVVFNSAINFVLYVSTNVRFRHTLRTQICKLPPATRDHMIEVTQTRGVTVQTETLLSHL